MNLMSTSARAPVDLHSLKVIVPSTVDSVAFVRGRITEDPQLPAETPPLFSDRAIYRMGSGSGRPVDAAATVEMVETSDSIWSSSLICHRQPITGRSGPTPGTCQGSRRGLHGLLYSATNRSGNLQSPPCERH